MATTSPQQQSHFTLSNDLAFNLQKKYSLVKWLENSQFDMNNDWLGRLTSVPHSNIIDYDVDELKAGMEINLLRNGGEIWRAQVIIPKTASYTVDLPPSSHKVSKIRTKAMGTGNKLSESQESVEHYDSMERNFVDLTEFTVDEDTSNKTQNNFHSLDSNSKLSKELQLLQKAINEAGLTDLYQSLTHSTSNFPQQSCQASSTSNTNNNLIKTSQDNLNLNSVQVCDGNLETILQMQCELLEQQKELKTIEFDTLEQLKLLYHNLDNLSKKFDSFENVILNYTSQQENLSTSCFRATKSNLSKLNTSLQNIKLNFLK